MYCKSCGQSIDEDSTFCRYCGASQVPAQVVVQSPTAVLPSSPATPQWWLAEDKGGVAAQGPPSALISDTGTASMKCLNCGSMNPSGTANCVICGRSLTPLNPDSPAQVHPAPAAPAYPTIYTPTPSPYWVSQKPRTPKWVYGIIAVVVGFVGLIFLISLGGRSSNQFVPAPTYTQNTQSTHVQAYLAKLTEWSGTYTSAFQSIGTLSANPQIGDTSWSENMVLTLALIQSTDKEVFAYSPPSSMAYIHSQMITAANHLENMVSDMTHGIDNRDSSLLQAGASELDQASAIYKDLGPQVAAIGK